VDDDQLKKMVEINRKRESGEKLTPDEEASLFQKDFPPVDKETSIEPSVKRRKEALNKPRRK
jgi:hypothetical protein